MASRSLATLGTFQFRSRNKAPIRRMLAYLRYMCSSKNILISLSAFCVSGVPPTGKKTKPWGAPVFRHHQLNFSPTGVTAHPHTWVQLQHRLCSAHSPLRSHQHAIIEQWIECSTREDRWWGFQLRHIGEERRDIRVSPIFFAGGREVCGDVTATISV